MKIRLPRAGLWNAHTAGMLAFLALFPGFFFYHTALGLGLIGAFLGGYFAPVALLVAGPLVYFYVRKVRYQPGFLAYTDVAWLMYMLFFSAIVAVNAMAGANPAIVTNHALAVLFMMNVFLMFRLTGFGERFCRLVCMAALLGMSAIVFAYSVDGSFYLAPLGTARNPESLATYQGFSRSYLFTFAVVIAFARGWRLRVLLYLLAAPTLFVNTARSEFAAMLFMIPIIELYHARRKFLVASLFGVALLLAYMNLELLLSLLPNNRILELVDLSHSTSASKRHHLSAYAWHTITQFPWFGDYASYNPGFYAHNVLSAWVDTGLFGFLFVLGIVIVPAIPLFFRGYFARPRNGQLILAIALACITVLMQVSAHYFTDMLIGATLGAYSAYLNGRKNGYHRTPDLGPSAPRHPDLHQAMPMAGGPRA